MGVSPWGSPGYSATGPGLILALGCLAVCNSHVARRRRSKKNEVSTGALLALGLIALFVAYPAIGVGVVLVVGVGAFAWRAEQRREAQRRAERLLGYSLGDLDGLTGAEFEKWVTAVLEGAGIPAENIRDRGDFGVDVVASVGRVRVGIQVKRLSGSVGNSAVQEALAGSSYHDCSLAAVVTQSRFTSAARKQAARARVPVLLVDRKRIHDLARLVQEFARSGKAI